MSVLPFEMVHYYCGTRTHYLYEALLSAYTLRRIHPRVHVSVHSQFDVTGDCRDLIDDLTVTPAGSDLHPYAAKVVSLHRAATGSCLYLDTDTFVAGSLHDIAPPDYEGFALADFTGSPGFSKDWPPLNTGVVFFSRGMHGHVGTWASECTARQDTFRVPSRDTSPVSIGDQDVFNDLAEAEGWPVVALDPCRHNLRYNIFSAMAPGADLGDVRIFHMRECSKKFRQHGAPEPILEALDGFGRMWRKSEIVSR